MNAPQQPTGPQYPQAQYSQPQYPQGYIDLTIQGSVMTSNMITPDVVINGYRIPTSYGYQQVPMQPGPVHIEAYAQWMRRYGQASMDFTIAPGQRVPVFYAAPMHQFTTGSMGHEKQKRKGLAAFLGIMALIIVPVVLMLVVAVSL